MKPNAVLRSDRDTTRAKPKLKPCPFCGKLPAVEVSNFETGFWISCKTYDCWTNGPHRGNSNAAIKAWNRRPYRTTEPTTPQQGGDGR